MPDIDALKELFATHNEWLGVAIAVTAFAESFALLGIIVPGVAILSAAAFVAGTGSLNIFWALSAAALGAILGDGISFLLGRIFHEDIKRSYPFSAHPDWVDNAESFFARHGWKSVIAGRFIGPIRPVIPLVAGIVSMPTRQFFAVNLGSALVWSPVYIVPGYLLGAAVETRFSSPAHILGLVAAVICVPAFFLWVRRHFR